MRSTEINKATHNYYMYQFKLESKSWQSSWCMYLNFTEKSCLFTTSKDLHELFWLLHWSFHITDTLVFCIIHFESRLYIHTFNEFKLYSLTSVWGLIWLVKHRSSAPAQRDAWYGTSIFNGRMRKTLLKWFSQTS